MFNKILVPLDGSKIAEKALPYAEEMAVEFGSKVTLLSAGAPEDTPQHDEYYEYLNKTSAALEAHMKKTGHLPPQKKVNITTAITGRTGLFSDPAAEILDYADKEDHNMIIMSSHGRTGILRWVFGSTANKVIQAFSCPLLLIRAKMDIPEYVHIKKIIVPLDGSRESEAALPYAEAFAKTLKSDITLLHVVELLYHVYAYPSAVGYGGDGIVRVPYTPEEMQPFVETGTKYIRGISDKLKEKDIEHKLEVRTGSPADEIIEAEGEMNPDLIIMSTHGQSGFGRFDHGSVADKVLHSGGTPLLLVRPQQPSVKPSGK